MLIDLGQIKRKAKLNKTEKQKERERERAGEREKFCLFLYERVNVGGILLNWLLLLTSFVISRSYQPT